MKKRIHSKTYHLLRRLFAALIAAAVTVCVLPPAAVLAAYDDDDEGTETYSGQITLRTITDADGWNSASIKLYGRRINGSAKEMEIGEWNGIQGQIDDEGDTYTCTYTAGDYFPTRVEVYTDFGGGFTWRSWEGSLKLYVNGINVKSEILRATSSPFSSSSHTNNVNVDRANYPYPERINIITFHPSSSIMPREEIFDTFYQKAGEPFCEGYAFVYAYDQYGRVWETSKHDIMVENLSFPDSDTGTLFRRDYFGWAVDGLYFNLNSSKGVDHKSTYKFTFPTSNTARPTVSRTFDATFIFRNSVDIVLGDETVFSGSNYKGKFINIPEDTPGVTAPAGYRITGFVLDGAGTVTGDAENGFQYTFGTAPAVLTARLTPAKYSIAFDGNGAQSGTVKNISNLAFDKMQKLPACAFSRTGYKFTGWNTEPDGSGETYAAMSFVSKLSEEDGSTVTLYAQWERLVYNVTLVYPEELGLADEVLSVGYGDSVPVSEIIYADSEDGHYEFVSADKPLDNIRANAVIHLDYAKKAHTFGADNITKEANCTEHGEKENVCEICGYTKLSEIPANEHKHDYGEGVWVWSEDHRSAGVTASCSRCGDTLFGNTADNGEVAYADSGTTRTYTASVSVDAGENGMIEFVNETVCRDLLERVSFVDENGNTKTVNAVPLTSTTVPDGEYYAVGGNVELSDALIMNDVKLILCDGASLSVSTDNNGGSAIYVYKPDDTENNTGSFTIYGQTAQSGSLNISGSGGIVCGSFAQYGGHVKISSSACAVHAEAPAVYGGNIEIYGGELEARSSMNDALLCEHGDVIISGGRITADGGWGNNGVVAAERSVILGCEDADGFIKVSSLSAPDTSIQEGQVLSDGFFYYSGIPDGVHLAALSGKKLSRFYGEVPSASDAAAAGSLFGRGSATVVLIGFAAIAGALAVMAITAFRRKKIKQPQTPSAEDGKE